MFANAGFLFRCATESQRGASSLNPTSEQAQRESLSSVVQNQFYFERLYFGGG